MPKTREIENSGEIGEAREVDDVGKVGDMEKMIHLFSMGVKALD